MAEVLLDTDILSDILKGKNAAVAAKASAYLAEHGRFTTSALTVAEIVYGLRRVGREGSVALFEASLADVEVLPFDDDAARLAGRINADLERAGAPSPTRRHDCCTRNPQRPCGRHGQHRALRACPRGQVRSAHRQLALGLSATPQASP